MIDAICPQRMTDMEKPDWAVKLLAPIGHGLLHFTAEGWIIQVPGRHDLVPEGGNDSQKSAAQVMARARTNKFISSL
jgi:hypothetical protein